MPESVHVDQKIARLHLRERRRSAGDARSRPAAYGEARKLGEDPQLLATRRKLEGAEAVTGGNEYAQALADLLRRERRRPVQKRHGRRRSSKRAFRLEVRRPRARLPVRGQNVPPQA